MCVCVYIHTYTYLHVNHNHITILDQCEGPAICCFGRNVADHDPVGGTGETPVGDEGDGSVCVCVSVYVCV